MGLSFPPRKAAPRRENTSIQGPAPGKETYFEFQLLLGARAGFACLVHLLLISTGQPVRLLGRQGHCRERRGRKREEVGPEPPKPRCQAVGPPAPCGFVPRMSSPWRGAHSALPVCWSPTALSSAPLMPRAAPGETLFPGCLSARCSGHPSGPLRPLFSAAQVSILRPPRAVLGQRASE